MDTDANAVIGDATLTASGIARLAGVRRAAVSNWRRRYTDFPAPIGGTPTSPHFSARAVNAWLRRQGKFRQTGVRPWAWRHIETYQPAAEIGHALAITGAYLLVHAQLPDPDRLPTPVQLTVRLKRIDPTLAALVKTILPAAWTPQLTTVLTAVNQLARDEDPETAFEYLYSQYTWSAQSISGLAGTPDAVGEIMLAIAGTGTRTLDFTCGTGSLLRLAADRALAAGTTTQCLGQEIKGEYAMIALIRLNFVRQRGSGTLPRPLVAVSDTLHADAYPDLQADVVVANPPFGIHDWGHDRLVYDSRWRYGVPPRTEPELAWLQHGLAHLTTGGTAVILMPPAAAARPAGRRIRAELVRRGTLRAVIALPAGLMPPVGVGLHLWVLVEPPAGATPDARILFINAAHVDPLTAVIGDAWRTFQSGTATAVPGVVREVSAMDVLDDRVNLTPHRHVNQADGLGEPMAIIERITELNCLLEMVSAGVPDVHPAPQPYSAPLRIDLSDLAKAGSIRIRYAHIATGGTEPWLLETDDIIVPAALASTSLAPAAQEGGARVITSEEAGTEVPQGHHVLRVDPDQLDPWFVAGMVSRRPEHDRTRSGISRTGVRGLSIPVMPIDEQKAIGRYIERLVEIQAGLRIAAEVSGSLTLGIQHAFASGTISVASDSPPS